MLSSCDKIIELNENFEVPTKHKLTHNYLLWPIKLQNNDQATPILHMHKSFEPNKFDDKFWNKKNLAIVRPGFDLPTQCGQASNVISTLTVSIKSTQISLNT